MRSARRLAVLALALVSGTATVPARAADLPGLTSPTIRTVAGGASGRFCGDGGPATSECLAGPTGLVTDRAGSLYVSEGRRVRRVAPDGTITTVAGRGPRTCRDDGPLGDGGPATEACLLAPRDVAVGPGGSLYIADTGNDRVRRVTP